MGGRTTRHLVLLCVALAAWTACKARTDAAPQAAASVSGSVATVPAAPPPPETCAKDDDCVPYNCCFALKPASCGLRARAHCDGFAIKCEPYDGPRYACACVLGQCTGNPSGPSGADGGIAAAPSWATGDLKPGVVLDGIIKHGPDIRACQAQAKKARGEVSMQWTILPSGKVDRPLVASSTVGSPPLTTCLTRKIGVWRFPKAKGPTRVKYDFRFAR